MTKQYIPFIGILMIAFIAFLEYMVVANALPSIQNTFHVSILNLQWLANVYSIVIATTMILFGRLGDMFGYRRIFYFGVFLLIIGSFGAGFVDGFGLLIFFRGIQSLGISSIIVLAPGIIQLLFLEKAHMPMSIYSTIGGIGLLLGPYIGGLIVTHFGWQWVFYINVPLLIIAMFICLPFVPRFKANSQIVKTDWSGNILLVISLTSLIYGLIREQQVGIIGCTNCFDHLTGISFIIFVISAPLLIYVELNKEHPVLNFSFFKQPYFVLAVLMNLIAGALVSCGMFFSPIFLQNIVHLSPTAAGTILLTFAIGTVVFSPIIGRLVKKIGEGKTMLLGLYCGLASSVFYVLFFAYSSLVCGILAFCLTGMTLAVNNTASVITAIKGVGEKNAGAAIGTIFAVFNAVAAIMLAITTVLLHMVTGFNHYASIESNAQFGYALIFGLIALYALVILIIGFKYQPSHSQI